MSDIKITNITPIPITKIPVEEMLKQLIAERDCLKNRLELMMTAHSPKCFSEISRLKAEEEKK